MKLSIILPTLAGRERVFDKVLAAYEATRPSGWEFDVIVPEGFPTVGEAWTSGMRDADGDYALLAVDDAEPHAGWCDVASQTADSGSIPAPRLQFPDGTLESCGSMGFGVLLPESPDGTPCLNTGIIFIRREWWDVVGEMPPLHYAVDNYWTWKARVHGFPCLYRSGMRFTHYHERAGSERVLGLAQEHIRECVRLMSLVQVPGKRVAAMTRI